MTTDLEKIVYAAAKAMKCRGFPGSLGHPDDPVCETLCLPAAQGIVDAVMQALADINNSRVQREEEWLEARRDYSHAADPLGVLSCCPGVHTLGPECILTRRNEETIQGD